MGTALRSHHVYALLMLFGLGAGCRDVLGVEPATLVCPPDFPDCKLCIEPADCGSRADCYAWACKDNRCTTVNAPARSPCAAGVCSDDIVSKCVACVSDEDCPSGGHCGPDRACHRCDDGQQNGYEYGVDCGGPCSKKCLGWTCASADECDTGICTDGNCCVSTCEYPCAYCIKNGDCVPMPKYAYDHDPEYECSGKYACDGFGGCRLRPGEICTSHVECASSRCVKNRCVMLAGEPCTNDLQCADGACEAGACSN